METSPFPKSFQFGVSTAAFQIEGSLEQDGRGPSIWDEFAQIPGKIVDGSFPSVSCNHYADWEEDIRRLQDLEVDAYRFSLAWPRILPEGTGQPNSKGIAFYDRLIDRLLEAGIKPWVTLYHWDLPLALHHSGCGWHNPGIVPAFTEYCDLCFRTYGDRVRDWITFNEPWCTAVLGYGTGYFAPGIRDREACYLAGHHQLIAHGKVSRLYRDGFKSTQNGRIGMANNCDYRHPASGAPADQEAAQRALEFFLGWFADPLYLGDYPESMRDTLGPLLPKFTEQERSEIQGSCDFFALNHYTTNLAAAPKGMIGTNFASGNGGFMEDLGVDLSNDPSWENTHRDWRIVPWGLTRLLEWIDRRYGHPEIFITENGFSISGDNPEDLINDPDRIRYTLAYLNAASDAINSGVDLRGYFHWCLADDFDWANGYSCRFGLYHTDGETGSKRIKRSGKWYAEYIRQHHNSAK